jgi:hypothetical protein
MWRSVLLVVVLAGVLAGCNVGGGHAAGSGGSAPVVHHGPTEPLDAEIKVEQMRIPAGNLPPLKNVVCHVVGKRATCTGRGADGTLVATQGFTIEPNGSLVPWCPPGSGMPSIYCRN